MSVQITCKFTKIVFEAPNRRTQVHPTIAGWKQHASKKNWHGHFFEAIEYGLKNGYSTIEQFEAILAKASRGEPFEVAVIEESLVTPRNAVIAAIDSDWRYEVDRAKGSFCKRITGIDTRIDTGYSLLGKFVDINKIDEFNEIAGRSLYLDCATSAPSNNDIRKQRMPSSAYTLFSYIAGEVFILLCFSGRRLSESPKDLVKIWEIAEMLRIPDAKNGTKKEQQEEVTKIFYDPKWSAIVGATIKIEDTYYVVVRIDTTYEDEDGIAHKKYRSSYDAGAVLAFTYHSYGCRLATAEEIAAEQAREAIALKKRQAKTRLVEIRDAITVAKGAISPTAVDYPKSILELRVQGSNILVVSDSQIWNLLYNGNYGDDWSLNNVGNIWIGCYIELTPELKMELEAIAAILDPA